MTPTLMELEAFAHHQRAARSTGRSVPVLPEDWDLRGANLRGVNLRGADLRGAPLRDADLTDADLRGADLRGADLRGAKLRLADITGATLAGAHIAEGGVIACVSGGDDVINWHALRVDAAVILQFGFGRAPLASWHARGLEYVPWPGHPAERYNAALSAAIAAAETLASAT